mgnify:CR=1 FL=1
MPIGGCSLQSFLIEAQMDSCKELFRFITTTGKQGCTQGFQQRCGIHAQGCSVLHERELRKIISRHSAHLIAAAGASELDLVSARITGQ